MVVEDKKFEHKEVSEAIIGASFEVYNTLGYGFLEKVYQKALQVELIAKGHIVDIEPALEVKYKGKIIGKYVADLLVDKSVIVELKVSRQYNRQDEAQLLNELKASDISVGLLINFGRSKVEFKRLVF